MLDGRDFDVTEFAIPVVTPLWRCTATSRNTARVFAEKGQSKLRFTRNELLIFCKKGRNVGGAWLPVLFATQ